MRFLPLDPHAGELDALATENEGIRFFVRDPEVGVVPILLDENEALRYAGYEVTVELDLGDDSDSPDGTNTPNTRRLLAGLTDNYSNDSDNYEDGSADYNAYGEDAGVGVGVTMTVTSFGPPGSSNPIPVRSIKYEGRAGGGDDSKGALPTGLQNVTAVVYLLSGCGWKPAITEANFRSIFFGTPSSAGASVAGLYSTCSQGKAVLRSENVQIYEVNVST
jgi:hypothetical protein